jgi:formylglycine-generating enzyme
VLRRLALVVVVATSTTACGSSEPAADEDASLDAPADDTSAGDDTSDATSRDASSDVATIDSARADVVPDAIADADTRSSSDADARPTCPADMVALPGVCMDRYEAPNVAGAKPLAMQTAPDGEAWCKTKGKRLCSEAEWVRACNGTTKSPYPYGATYVRGKCTDDKTWISPNWTTLGTWPSAAAKTEAERLYQADPSGARTGCVSEEGVVDLTGNVAEWVTRSFPNVNNYDHVMKGCYWAGCYGGSPPSCAFVNPAHPGGFRTYEAGFRCCL